MTPYIGNMIGLIFTVFTFEGGQGSELSSHRHTVMRSAPCRRATGLSKALQHTDLDIVGQGQASAVPGGQLVFPRLLSTLP